MELEIKLSFEFYFCTQNVDETVWSSIMFHLTDQKNIKRYASDMHG